VVPGAQPHAQHPDPAVAQAGEVAGQREHACAVVHPDPVDPVHPVRLVADHDGPIIESNESTAEVILDEDKYVAKARYQARGTEWEFEAVQRGQMRSLARNVAIASSRGSIPASVCRSRRCRTTPASRA